MPHTPDSRLPAMRPRGRHASKNRIERMKRCPPRAGIAARLTYCASETGIALREIDALAGTTPGHAHAVARGAIPDPRVSTLSAFADIFGVSLDWLARGQGVSPSPDSILAAVASARAARVASPSTETA